MSKHKVSVARLVSEAVARCPEVCIKHEKGSVKALTVILQRVL